MRELFPLRFIRALLAPKVTKEDAQPKPLEFSATFAFGKEQKQAKPTLRIMQPFVIVWQKVSGWDSLWL